MRWMVNVVYALGLGLLAPVWMLRLLRTGKYRTDWNARFGGGEALPALPDGSKRILIHAVSVGEVNAIRLLVQRLRDADPPPDIVIATTTDTGFARAKALYGDEHAVVRYPFDFSFAVNRFLRRMRPNLVALVELEVWPNFTSVCHQHGIPVCVTNGRLSARSFKRYRLIRALVMPSFRRLAAAGVQNDEYAQRFRALGAASVHVLGTMKWDTAQIADDVTGAEELAIDLGIDRSRPLVVAGSTAPGEHELLHAAVPDGVQLLCAPRKPEWFDQAADALPGCVRRSNGRGDPASNRFLLDTIGELRMAYALADLVVIGRSFGNLHGSDMMEPIALGKAVIVGPAVGDFYDTVNALLEGEGIRQVATDALAQHIAVLLEDGAARTQLAANGRAVIRAQQGATQRYVELLRKHLP
jgi:3-deoxy-D-manno-octulosonic-acid transferase